MTALACWILSYDGFALAKRIVAHLAANPWQRPPCTYSSLDLFAPTRLAQASPDLPITAVDRIKPLFDHLFHAYPAHLFLGATGIAVRCIDGNCVHKSRDPAVLVLDAKGRFVISLLSGHLGGANSLCTHLAFGLNAQPVITTASEGKDCPKLDLLAHSLSLRILDWDTLPFIQGLLLEGKAVALVDCDHILPQSPLFLPSSALSPLSPAISVSVLKTPKKPNLLRLVPQWAVLGIGCKKNLAFEDLVKALELFFDTYGFDQAMVCALATVREKTTEPALVRLAQTLSLPLHGFPAEQLARIPCDHPSPTAGDRFHTQPFSVAECASRLLAETLFGAVCALPKHAFFHTLTLALAGPIACLHSPLSA
ncbi:MAG: cobalamin biosynthesis protein [Desulfovibrio sp.]|nr:cobalamin biosynthesis protein [Desulfovibrio sp.]